MGLDGVIVWEIIDKTILNVPFRYLGMLQVYSHDDLYVIPEIGTGGSKLMQSDLGLYLDSGYLISLGNKTAKTTPYVSSLQLICLLLFERSMTFNL